MAETRHRGPSSPDPYCCDAQFASFQQNIRYFSIAETSQARKTYISKDSSLERLIPQKTRLTKDASKRNITRKTHISKDSSLERLISQKTRLYIRFKTDSKKTPKRLKKDSSPLPVPCHIASSVFVLDHRVVPSFSLLLFRFGDSQLS